jgi:hypothetical protein
VDLYENTLLASKSFNNLNYFWPLFTPIITVGMARINLQRPNVGRIIEVLALKAAGYSAFMFSDQVGDIAANKVAVEGCLLWCHRQIGPQITAVQHQQ